MYLNDHSLWFSVQTIADNQLLLLQEFKFDNNRNKAQQLQSFFQKNELIQWDYRDVFVAIESQQNSLLPTKLKNHAESVFIRENGEVNNGFELFEENIAELDGFSTSLFHTELLKTIKELFPKAFITSSNAAWIKQSLIQGKINQNTLACIWLFPNGMHLNLVARDKLIFSNTFEVESTEDILYFLLFALDQLNITAKEIVVSLQGKSRFAVDEALIAEYVSVEKIQFQVELPTSGTPSYSVLENQALLIHLALCV
ncbi:MAG: DUF3822 family protein [Flavobacteriales bacterium]|nr:DUF3822 family protein [Flavobacteriales bacterium]